MTQAHATALDALDRVQGALAQALREGQADALAPLAERLRQGLALLHRVASVAPVPAAMRPRVAALLQRAQASQALLARRQDDVQRSLESLGATHAGLQDLQARRVYGSRGAMSATPWRSRGFETA